MSAGSVTASVTVVHLARRQVRRLLEELVGEQLDRAGQPAIDRHARSTKTFAYRRRRRSADRPGDTAGSRGPSRCSATSWPASSFSPAVACGRMLQFLAAPADSPAGAGTAPISGRTSAPSGSGADLLLMIRAVQGQGVVEDVAQRPALVDPLPHVPAAFPRPPGPSSRRRRCPPP